MPLLMVLFIILVLFAVFGAVIFAFLVYYVLYLVILALIQMLAVGVVNKVTGKKFEPNLSAESFIIETIILIALVACYASLPAKPVSLDAEACSSVYYQSGVPEYKGGEPDLTHKEPIEEMVGRLKELKLSRTLPTTIKYAYPNAKTGSKFEYLYFFDEEGGFLQSVCYYDNLLGVSNKLDGKYTYYNTKKEIDKDYIRREIFRQEDELRSAEQYGDIIQAMEDSFQYENGTYTFTVPSFGGDYFNIEIFGNEEVYYSQVIKSTGYEMKRSVKQDTIYYLAEHTEAEDWQEGQSYSFTLEETTYGGIYCRVYVKKGVELKFKVPLTDEAYIADREHPVINYIE